MRSVSAGASANAEGRPAGALQPLQHPLDLSTDHAESLDQPFALSACSVMISRVSEVTASAILSSTTSNVRPG